MTWVTESSTTFAEATGLQLRQLARRVMTPNSITHDLFIRGVLIVLSGMLLVSVAAVGIVSLSVNHGHDMQLRMGARMLLSLMGEELTDRRAVSPRVSPSCAQPLLSAEDREAFADFARWRMFRVSYGGKICWESRAGQTVPDPAAGISGQFSDWRRNGQDWRYYTYAAKRNGPVVQVGEPVAERQRIVARIVIEMILPFLLIAIILLVALLFGLNTALQSLRNFGDELAAQNDRPPFRPLSSGDWPHELHPLVQIADTLFKRIESEAQRERRFVDMAAHQLRTPLAALAVEARVAARTEAGPELQTRLTSLHSAAHRVSGLVDQLLALAQIEGGLGGTRESLSVRATASSVIAELAPFAAQSQVEIALEGEDLKLDGDGTALHLLLANLIGNAVKYAPRDSEVVVCLHPGAWRMTITDTGPGLPQADKLQAFERFWRASGNKRDGAGLGLAIVREAADVLGLRVSLLDRPDGASGLQVEITSTAPSCSSGQGVFA